MRTHILIIAPAASGLGVTSNTTAVPPVSPPSMLRGKTIEEIVNRWSSDLDHHVREFNKFAGEVSVWDRALIENGNNVSIDTLDQQCARAHFVILVGCIIQSCIGYRTRTERYRPVP
jgi:Nsp1-like C-terminal region